MKLLQYQNIPAIVLALDARMPVIVPTWTPPMVQASAEANKTRQFLVHTELLTVCYATITVSDAPCVRTKAFVSDLRV